MDVTDRQRFILRKVVEGHDKLDSPVGSRWLAGQDDVPWGSSTIRTELARLEDVGLLEHPHTSAGRVPTETGYRYYVDEILKEGVLPETGKAIELSDVRREVDAAMQATTERLSQVTNLLALVSSPPIETATIRHVEVLALQPHVAVVVVITSTGGITKRVVSFEVSLDAGLVDWAGAYLNEELGGLDVGSRLVAARLTDPDLTEREREFLEALAPAFTELDNGAGDTLFVDGAARLFSEQRFQELPQLSSLLDALERRVALLSVMRASLSEPSVYLRIGSENPTPELRSVTMVAANYGVPRRNLGAVGVLGPVRMDYPTAIIAVRQAAAELSRFVAEVYDE